MRVYELAKLHGLESKDVLDICKKHKVDVKPSASAALTDKDCRKLMPHIEQFKKNTAAPRSVEKKPREEAKPKTDAPAHDRQPVSAARKATVEAMPVKDKTAPVPASVDVKKPAAGKIAESKSPVVQVQATPVVEPKKAVAPKVDSAMDAHAREMADRRRQIEEKRQRERLAAEALHKQAEEAKIAAQVAKEAKIASTEVSEPVLEAPRKIVPSAAVLSRNALDRDQTGASQQPRRFGPGQGQGQQGERRYTSGQGQGQQGERRYTPGQGQGQQGERRYTPGQGQGQQGERRYTPGQGQGQQGERRYTPGQGQGQQGERRYTPGQGQGQQGERRYTPGQGQGQQGERRYTPGQGQGQQGERRYTPGQGQQGERRYTPGQGGQQGERRYTPGQGQQGERRYTPGQGQQGERRYTPGQGQQGERRYTPGQGQGQQGERRYGGPGQGQSSGGRRDSNAPVRLTEDNLPQIGVMRGEKPGARVDRRDKRPATSSTTKGKIKPSAIFELNESVSPRKRNSDLGSNSTRTLLESAAKGARGARPGVPKRKKRYYDQQRDAMRTEPSVVSIDSLLSVGDFAERCGVSPSEVIKHLMLNGQMLTINQSISTEMMELIAIELGVEIEVHSPKTDADDILPYFVVDNPANAQRRAPVVTIMGHVDHGKTTLLDRIRMSNVVDDEFGGITQHIGAYSVQTPKGRIAFLDTPGHEAFTAMRARGAAVTDIVILVVSADDGFMPQTIEAINHAQAANVPIIVAVNKIDLPSADPAKARQEALQHNLVPEEFGGDTMFVDISAKKSINIENLLEFVALHAELLDLKADSQKPAVGVVVESRLDPLRGAVATVLIQSGTLKQGDAFVCGDISGNVRAMNDDHGRPIKVAGPSTPVEIIGLSGSPTAGESFNVLPDERTAREIAERRMERRRQATLSPVRKHVTLQSLFEQMSEGKVKELGIILKADVQGSVEAISQSLAKIGTEDIRIRILHSGVGGINESDVNLADASNAIIIGFNVRPDASADEHAKQTGVEIKLYRIIYDLTKDLREALTGMLDMRFEEKIIGHARVDQVFKVSRVGSIAGCFVTDGELMRDASIRLVRNNTVIYEGKLGSLKRFKEDAKKVTTTQECGLTIENYNDLKEGDIVEAYIVEEFKQTLEELENKEQQNS